MAQGLNRISNFRYKWVNGLRIMDAEPTLGKPYVQSTKNNFAPRIGFAWDPFRDGKLAVRGGAGVFYDQWSEAEFIFFAAKNVPFYQNLVVNNPPFPMGFSGSVGAPPLPAAEGLDFNMEVPTRWQYSLGIQRQISSDTAFNIGYVGARSTHLKRRIDPNIAVPGRDQNGVVYYANRTPRIQPALASTRLVLSDGNGWYNSLQMDFIQRATRGLRYKVSYTFAKNMDEDSKIRPTQVGPSGATGADWGAQDPYDRAA